MRSASAGGIDRARRRPADERGRPRRRQSNDGVYSAVAGGGVPGRQRRRRLAIRQALAVELRPLLDGVGQRVIVAEPGPSSRLARPCSTAAENSPVSASAAASVSTASRLLAVGKLDRTFGQPDRPRSVADRGIGTRRQDPGGLPQHRDDCRAGVELPR